MKKQAFQSVTPNINFPEMEKRILREWYELGIVDKYLHRNDGATKRFSFLDGPITANNPMGVHHAWGRTYKDLWQRYHTLKGEAGRYRNGFDCQGLWVEVEVEKELGIKNKRDIEQLVPGDKKASIAKFVELCRERVRKYSAIQTEQSKRLGYFMDWDNSYYTMSDENNYMIWHFLKTCYEKGWIYKGKDSVPWCPRCQTAISQHEMLTEDYKELTHETVLVKLPITTKGWEHTYLLVWTTTPWTVPANVAVGINKKYRYGVWKDEYDERYIFLYTGEEGAIAKRIDKKEGEVSLERWIMKDSGKTLQHTGKTMRGDELFGLQYEAPFDHLPIVQKAREESPKTFHTVVDGSDIVVSNEGTGLLHVAPGAGKEDFDLGKKEKLPVISVIDDEANYLDGMNEFSGKNAKKHPELIVDYLKTHEQGKFFLKSMPFTHRYPACWRCKTELVWKVADEWYIAMDRPEQAISHQPSAISKKNKTLREQMKDTAKMIDWHPGFGLERELDWLSNMHDWLISKKNRYWGLALPIYECEQCRWFTVIGSKEELQEKAVSGWSTFDGHSPHKPFIDEVKITCEKCGETVSRLNDVGNVWLDAGIVGFSTLTDPTSGKLSYTTDKKYWKKWYPADFITESFPGQFKNWFYSMIAMSTVLEKKACFRTVLGFASMLGEDGRPMHKSWGNAIEFNEGADTIGADVMRWMFAKHNPEHNLLFGYRHADDTRRTFHLLLWNVYNFFVTYANVDGWQGKRKKEKGKSENILDRWILSKLNRLIALTTQSLEAYDAATAAHALEEFVLDLSQWYVRRSRDRVGPTEDNSLDKADCHATLYEVLTTLMKLLAPFTPYLAEEVYKNLTGEESVHLQNWPKVNKNMIDDILERQMHLGRSLVEIGHALRKEYKLKTRLPLALGWHNEPKEKLTNIDVLHQVLEELNIKGWIHEDNFSKFTKITGVVSKEINGLTFWLDTRLTSELAAEGQARELIRQIQMLRKEKGCRIDEHIAVQIPKEYGELDRQLRAYIQKETLADTLTWGDSLTVSTG